MLAVKHKENAMNLCILQSINTAYNEITGINNILIE